MDTSTFIAVDIGAGSGRIILGIEEGGKIVLEEVYRFKNRMVKIHGHYYWDLPFLFEEMKIGLRKAAKHSVDIVSIGIDTWGVDYGLLGRDNQIVGNPVAYRDSRTDGMMEKVFQLLPQQRIYELTGIQFLQFNTIYQLFSLVLSYNSILNISDKLLFMPDLFNYLLTGRKAVEYTIASTSQMVNIYSKTWDSEIFGKLNLPLEIMPEIIFPTDTVGKLLPDIEFETGLKNVDVIAVGSHDTASAVIAVPSTSKNFAYISSGTWSLVGIETTSPIVTENSFKYGFTNEGGIEGTYRFLKNTMGLWILEQSIERWQNEDGKYTLDYDDLFKAATSSEAFMSIFDPDDSSFLNPTDMLEAISTYCKKTNQVVPKNRGQFVRCILESLAFKYRFIIDAINSFIKDPIEVVHIIGGGSKNHVLNQFTANAVGVKVVAGPSEATAVGNIMVQAMSKGVVRNLTHARSVIEKSFVLKVYIPESMHTWESAYQRAKQSLYTIDRN